MALRPPHAAPLPVAPRGPPPRPPPAERAATNQSGWKLLIARDRRSTVVPRGEGRGRATTRLAQKGRLDTGPARTRWPTRCFWLASLAAARSWDNDTWTSDCHAFYGQVARWTTHEMCSIVCTSITVSYAEFDHREVIGYRLIRPAQRRSEPRPASSPQEACPARPRTAAAVELAASATAAAASPRHSMVVAAPRASGPCRPATGGGWPLGGRAGEGRRPPPAPRAVPPPSPRPRAPRRWVAAGGAGATSPLALPPRRRGGWTM